ncbi:MerR family transcriptional regulator [Lichenifustis flavocetrariae]|uniref:MerR family transcriptional regulator n=1 Tax=Lichenifustis flavocetrariae TaxID=2949735 RepID=A0AA41Z0K8_9HYPH|nr:MerR family transcriptional regulator [Lichenifustis flavocetrariae]MCW6508245.1 MerR family transcriptional regulator [Lichenifustis flavocetrariae]
MNVPQRSESSAPSSKAKARPEPREQLFTIGDLAKEFSVSLRTLRFYEDRGLLSPYRDGTARFYREEDKSRLILILKGKQLGFTLGEIRDMLATKRGSLQPPTALSLNPEQIATQISHLERQRAEIEEAIEELRAAHKRLITPA